VKFIILKVPWWQTKSPSAWTCLFQQLFHSSTYCILAHLYKLLCCVKFDHFLILKFFSFQGVLHWAEDLELTWAHVWGVHGLRHLCYVLCEYKLLHKLCQVHPCIITMNLPCTRLPFFFYHHWDIVVLTKPLVYSLAVWHVIMIHHTSWTQSYTFWSGPVVPVIAAKRLTDTTMDYASELGYKFLQACHWVFEYNSVNVRAGGAYSNYWALEHRTCNSPNSWNGLLWQLIF